MSLLTFICLIIVTQSQQVNQYTTSVDPDGTHIWQSTSDFIPQLATFYGRIPIGLIMSMEFEFIWWGYTQWPEVGAYEMFFRVGCSAYIIQDPDNDPLCTGGQNCLGHGLRYPSLWITGTNSGNQFIHVSVAKGNLCQSGQTLNSYGNINIGTSYHMVILDGDNDYFQDILK